MNTTTTATKGGWEVKKIGHTRQCFDGLTVEGFNRYTGETFFWLIEAQYVARNRDYDTSGAVVIDERAASICTKYGIVTGG